MFEYKNYQLYRSNVLLGGQMKYDLVVKSHRDSLYVEDFHITPVSDSCPFSRLLDDNLLNYSHKENISRYYKKISGSFYNSFLNPILNNPYPIIIKDVENLTVRDNTFEMGCKRMKSYELYKKQFEFFCPIWLEKLGKDQVLSFRFEVYGDQEMSVLLSTKTLNLQASDSHKYHNKFVEYFKDYLKYVGVEDGDDSVMNIIPTKQFASISGFNVSTGLRQTKTLPNLISNMFKREIPLMEWDNQIIRNFPDNKLICNQLFNFNICFNLEDILKSQIVNMLGKDPLYIKLFVQIDGENIGLRDLYTNYEYIPRKSCDPVQVNFENSAFVRHPVQDTPNVLSYLRDHQGIDYVLKNKMSHEIIHWSLADNNSYICNAYNGFGGCYKDEDDKWISIDRIYGNTSNIMLNRNERFQNSTTWCNAIELDFLDKDINDVVEDIESLIKYCSIFNTSGGWVNNLKYTGIDKEALKIPILIVNTPTWSVLSGKLSNFYDTYTFGKGSKLVVLNGGYVFFTENVLLNDTFVYRQFIHALDELLRTQSSQLKTIDIMKLRKLYELLNANSSIKGQSIQILGSSVSIYPADGPTRHVGEVEYYKDDRNKGTYVYRYFGKIKPTFIELGDDTNFNYRYSKNVILEGSAQFPQEMNMIKTYSEAGYLPKYPSIGYYYIHSEKIENYLGVDWWKFEQKMFNNSLVLKLIPEFNLVIEEPTKYFDPAPMINDLLKETYKIDGDRLNYVFSLYKYDLIPGKMDVNEGQKYILKITLK